MSKQSYTLDSTPLVTLKNKLVKDGLQVQDIAKALYALKKHQCMSGVYSQDRWLDEGSDVVAIVNDQSGIEKKCILWGVNHYTGLNRHPNVIRAVQDAVEKYGTGAGTSGMSGGKCLLHKQIEKKISSMLHKDGVLLFPTGYTANLGILSTLPQKQDLILFDRECHASVIDGIRMSSAKWLSFTHNDINSLSSKLGKLRGKYKDVFVVVESAYSMSGDFAPIKEIISLKKKYKFFLYVDEAHTFGLYGSKGGGYCQQLGISDDVDFIMSTLSKATASIGGFFAGPKEFLPLLEWCANAYIFQACITPPDAAAICESLDILCNESLIVKRLHDNNAYMRWRLIDCGFNLQTSESPIIPIYIPDDQVLLRLNEELFEQGIFSVSIVYPAVKAGEGRIRFIVTARHTREHIDFTVNVLAMLAKKHGVLNFAKNIYK